MQFFRTTPILLTVLFIAGCTSTAKEPFASPVEPLAGSWYMELVLDENRLPFHFDLVKLADSQWEMHVHNAEETILVDDVRIHSDSIRVRLPLFDSEFVGVIRANDRMEGQWYNYLKGPDYRIPFVARAGEFARFTAGSLPSTDVSGRWATQFTPNDDEAYPAIGLFDQDRNGRVTGTFMTETGDYRFLEGRVSGDSLFLSCFDGSHAFLFKARSKDGEMEGRFWSGTHWQTAWTAHRDDRFALRDPDSLTHLREGYDMVDFRFPNLQGEIVSPKDPLYKDKVLIIQIMGSWCPNCVDETRLLNEVYAKYHHQGLEVLSIAFEKHADSLRAIRGLERFRDVLDVQYPILYAGLSSKAAAGQKLPFLDHVMSFPTCIMVDRQGMVRRIRTGIYGPSTGKHYITYKNHLEDFLRELLDEKGEGGALARAKD